MNKELQKRADKLMREVAEEIADAGASIETDSASAWKSHRVTMEGGSALVNIRVDEYFRARWDRYIAEENAGGARQEPRCHRAPQ